MRVEKQQMDCFLAKQDNQRCPITCIDPKFDSYITPIPRNNGFSYWDDSKFVQIVLYYDTMEIQENVEYYM